MTDKVDDLILQMQHLGASVRAAGQARGWEEAAEKLKGKAMRLAATAQADLARAEEKLREGEEKLRRAREPGISPLEAAELQTEGKRLVEENKPAAVKARAKVNFAQDQMDEADRRSWDALQASARAEAHAQLADELVPGGAISSALPEKK